MYYHYFDIHFFYYILFQFSANYLRGTFNIKIKQAISAHEQALCQLTVWFEFQSSDKKKDKKLCSANGIHKESNKETV